jgi:hypothetical protein
MMSTDCYSPHQQHVAPQGHQSPLYGQGGYPMSVSSPLRSPMSMQMSMTPSPGLGNGSAGPSGYNHAYPSPQQASVPPMVSPGVPYLNDDSAVYHHSPVPGQMANANPNPTCPPPHASPSYQGYHHHQSSPGPHQAQHMHHHHQGYAQGYGGYAEMNQMARMQQGQGESRCQRFELLSTFVE